MVLSRVAFAPGTVLWSAPSTPGFTATQIAQAVPTNSGPSLYSIQTNTAGTQSVVQAVTADGQMMWQQTPRTLAGNAMPDESGGLVVMQGCGASDPVNQPLTIVDLNASGSVQWQGTITPTINGTGVCLGGLPKMAIRQDGAVVMALPLQVSSLRDRVFPYT